MRLLLKTMGGLAACLLVIGGALYGGAYYEEVTIQRHCENDTSYTVINGKSYACLTQDQTQQILRRLNSRGT